MLFNFCSSCSYVNKYWVPPKRSLQLSPTSPSDLYRASMDQIGNARKQIPIFFFNAFSGFTIEHIYFWRNIGFFMILCMMFLYSRALISKTPNQSSCLLATGASQSDIVYGSTCSMSIFGPHKGDDFWSKIVYRIEDRYTPWHPWHFKACMKYKTKQSQE